MNEQELLICNHHPDGPYPGATGKVIGAVVFQGLPSYKVEYGNGGGPAEIWHIPIIAEHGTYTLLDHQYCAIWP